MDQTRIAEILLARNIQPTLVQHEDEWTPLREAWRGNDHTLGNRVQERHTYVQARALSGHSNAADVLLALQGAGLNVLSYTEVAQAATQPALTFDGQRNGFVGLSFGIIDVAIQIELVEFRPDPRVEALSARASATPAG